jgi:transcriptional regulator with XRE-family HTH domain
MTDSMLDYVLGQLELCKGHWATVAERTGISKRTIEKIASGEIADPGVRKIELLSRYFRASAAPTPSELRA